MEVYAFVTDKYYHRIERKEKWIGKNIRNINFKEFYILNKNKISLTFNLKEKAGKNIWFLS